MASSTTRPTASTSASRVSVLIEKPNSHMKVKAPISETGMVTIGTSVARKLRRKTKITEDDQDDGLDDRLGTRSRSTWR